MLSPRSRPDRQRLRDPLLRAGTRPGELHQVAQEPARVRPHLLLRDTRKKTSSARLILHTAASGSCFAGSAPQLRGARQLSLTESSQQSASGLIKIAGCVVEAAALSASTALRHAPTPRSFECSPDASPSQGRDLRGAVAPSSPSRNPQPLHNPNRDQRPNRRHGSARPYVKNL